jgi:putative transposase
MKKQGPPRLDEAVYNAPGTIAFVTAVTKHRVRFFEKAAISNMAIDVLLERAARDDVPIYAYCFMPDHMHLVVGASKSCGITRFMRELKSFVARRSWPLGVHRTVWQRSYYDTIERTPNDELWGDVRYTFRNPVDDKIVETWQEYPYSGSTEFSSAQVEEIFNNPIFYRSRSRDGDRYVAVPDRW